MKRKLLFDKKLIFGDYMKQIVEIIKPIKNIEYYFETGIRSCDDIYDINQCSLDEYIDFNLEIISALSEKFDIIINEQSITIINVYSEWRKLAYKSKKGLKMKFETEKYKEQALVLLMIEKQKEFLEDSSKTFLDGIKFGWLGTEVLTTYRYNTRRREIGSLSKEQNSILEKSLVFINDLGIPEEWFRSEWLEDNYLEILKQYETKGL